MSEHNTESVRGITLGEWRALTADLADETPIEMVVPAGGDAWRGLGLDVSVRLSHPTAVVIEADEGTLVDGSGEAS